MIESLLHKEETDRQYFRGKVDLARSLFNKQRDLNGTLLEVIKIQLIIIIYQQSSHLGCHATLCRNGLKCQQKFALKKFTILTRACRFHFAFASK